MLRVQLGFPLPSVDINRNVIINNVLSESECTKFLKLTNNITPVQSFSFEETNSLFSSFSKKMTKLLMDINIKNFEFEISYISGADIVVNNVNNTFDWFIDIVPESTRKITLLVFLSDNNEYDGGNFCCFPDRSFPPPSQGTAIVFPSFLIYRLEPVLKGNQKVMIIWGCGNSFR